MAYDFDGASTSDIDYTLSAGQTGFTIMSVAWWEYSDNNGQYRRVFHLDAGSQDWRVEYDDGWGYVFAVPWTTPLRAAWSITKPSTGSWFHYCATYDGSSTSNDPVIYINGVSQSVTERATPAGTIGTPSTSMWLGSTGSSNWHDAKVAEFALWHRVLTASEVEGLADGFSPSFYRKDIKIYIPLLRGMASDLIYGTAGTVDDGVTPFPHPRIIYPTGGL